ncbi:MAG: hypothetical protein AB7K24_04760, partial [Gemmataceae bacterium]
MNARWLLVVAILAAAIPVWGDGPGDNIVDKVRKIPPPGIAVPDQDRAELQQGLDELHKDIAGLEQALKGKAALLELIPDVAVYHKAVRYALQYDEFFSPNEIKAARGLLAQGKERAALLRQGKTPWTTATGLVVRGYVSKIDGSVQPYGLVVPASYAANTPHAFRLDCWFHGRGEKLSEVSFIDGRQKQVGQFAPRNAFVLHPY